MSLISTKGEGSGLTRIVALGLLAVAITAALGQIGGYVAEMPPFHADEAGHALAGARLAIGAAALDIETMTHDALMDPFWPFGHALSLVPSFLIFGLSETTARVTSLFWFALSIPLLYLIAQAGPQEPGAVAPARDWTTGLVAISLTLATPAHWMFASSVMAESLGLLLTLISVYSLIGAHQAAEGGCARSMLAGAAISATFLTKYNYAAGLMIVALGAVWFPRGRPFLPCGAPLLIALLVPTCLWLVLPFPTRLEWTFEFLRNRDEGLSGASDALFYLDWLSAEMGSPVALFVVAGAVLALARARHAGNLLFVGGPALITVAMMTAHPNKQNRYILTALPLLYLTAELGVRTTLAKLGSSGPGPTARLVRLGAVTASVAILVVLDPRPALRRDLEARRSQATARDLFAFAANHVNPGETVLFLGGGPLLPHLLLEWRMVERTAERRPRVLIPGFPGDESDGRGGFDPAMSESYGRALQTALHSPELDVVIAMECEALSDLCPEWLERFDGWRNNFAVAMREARVWPLLAERRGDARVTVRVYRRPSARDSSSTS